MRGRLDPSAGDAGAGALVAFAQAQVQEGVLTQVLPLGLDPEVDGGTTLPEDHPAWAKDVVSLSQRFRALAARVKPIVVRALTYWDHQVRSIMVGGRRMAVDGSGCYRLE